MEIGWIMDYKVPNVDREVIVFIADRWFGQLPHMDVARWKPSREKGVE